MHDQRMTRREQMPSHRAAHDPKSDECNSGSHERLFRQAGEILQMRGGASLINFLTGLDNRFYGRILQVLQQLSIKLADR
jgi:hypothetical protein